MYKPRNIKFKELLAVGDWKIKAYTISKNETFGALSTYSCAIENLSEWLTQLNSFDSSHDNISFLIVHEGTEGVFTLINTWVGHNMLQTHIFLSTYSASEKFTKISGDGLFACIWELEIINHERNSWIKNILKNSENPDYLSYLNDTLTAQL